MPKRSILSLVLGANIIRPSCRLHEQHEVTLGSRNILQPRLPLVDLPGMFLQHRFYLVDGRRVLLAKDLVSNDPREHMAGNVPRRRGKGQYGKREKDKGYD
jgi:hypothetical protein